MNKKTEDLKKPEIKKEISEIEKCNKEKNDLIALSQRLKADFINYKKDQEKMTAHIVKFANEDLISKLLPIINSFSRASTHIPTDIAKNQWVIGIEKIQNQINTILKEIGVTEITTIDKQFDPMIHEAVTQIEAEDEGRIVEELEKGYMLHDKVLRAAKVSITTKKEE